MKNNDAYLKAVLTLTCLFLAAIALRPLIAADDAAAGSRDLSSVRYIGGEDEDALLLDTKSGEIWHYNYDKNRVEMIAHMDELGRPLRLGKKLVSKDRQAEAKTNLGALFTTQIAYYGENNTYAGGRDAFDHLAWRPEGATVYNYYVGDDVIPCTKPGCDRCDSINVSPRSTRDSFVIYAAGNIDNDRQCDVWSMNDSKILRNERTDLE